MEKVSTLEYYGNDAVWNYQHHKSNKTQLSGTYFTLTMTNVARTVRQHIKEILKMLGEFINEMTHAPRLRI